MKDIKYIPISIVIPARNEETNIRRLLEDIKRQEIGPYEIIIADANSMDDTKKVANDYGAIITDGGWPSYGRNSGARIAKQDVILFLDADTGLKSETFLKDIFYTFQNSNLDCASCYFEPMHRNIGTHLVTLIMNTMKYLSRLPIKGLKLGFGALIMVKKSTFLSVNGFREDMRYMEDSQFIKDLTNAGFKYGLIPFKIQLNLQRETVGNPKKDLSLVLAFIYGFLFLSIPFKKLKNSLYEKAKRLYLSTEKERKKNRY